MAVLQTLIRYKAAVGFGVVWVPLIAAAAIYEAQTDRGLFGLAPVPTPTVTVLAPPPPPVTVPGPTVTVPGPTASASTPAPGLTGAPTFGAPPTSGPTQLPGLTPPTFPTSTVTRTETSTRTEAASPSPSSGSPSPTLTPRNPPRPLCIVIKDGNIIIRVPCPKPPKD